MNPIRCRFFVVLALLLPMILLAAGVQGQDSKKQLLPPGWGKLGLSDEQKTKIYEVQTEFGPKIEAIDKQLREVKAKERQGMEAILTPEQKQKLKEIKFEPKS